MARISELHYSNSYANVSGVSEFLEVALRASEDPADFTVSFYDADGTVGFEIALDSPLLTPVIDAENNEVLYVISADDFPILLTDPDSGSANNYEAFALTNTAAGNVIDFYDIGGGTQNIVAVDGAAATAAAPGTATSENIPAPFGPGSTRTSIQFNQPNPNTVVYETLTPGDTGPACLVAGTAVMTPTGSAAVETLCAGDMVITRDNGPQPLRWCGQQTVPGYGRYAPIRFRTGAHGATRDVYVSPQHRVLVTGWQAQLHFGEDEVLVPAKALIDDHMVRPAPQANVTYCHLLFDTHQIISAYGFWSESYAPVLDRCETWAQATQDELLSLFPALGLGTPQPLARPCLTVQMGRVLRQN